MPRCAIALFLPLNYLKPMKIHLHYLFLWLALGLSIFSCKKDSDSTDTGKNLKIKPSTLTLIVGSSTLLEVVWVDNAGNETQVTESVEWSSSASTVATAVNGSVIGGGMVTAISPGTAIITARAGGKSATCNLTSTGLDATGKVLFINVSTLALTAGEEFALSAFFIDQDANKTNVSASWSVNSTSIATVASDGKVKAVGEGATFVSATISEGGKTFKATIPLVVKKQVAKSEAGPSTSPLTGFVAAPAAILWSDASPDKDIQIEWVYFGSGTISAPTFSSSNTAVASVNATGLVTIQTSGEAIITINASVGSTNYSQKIPVVVVGMPTVALPVFRVDVTPGFKKSFMDKTIQFSAKAYNATGQEVTGKPVIWEIEDTEPDTAENGELIFAATVNGSGLVTTKEPRQVKVKATVEGITGTADLWIYPDGFYTTTPLFFTMPFNGSQNITANYFEFDDNFQVQAKPFPATTQWAVLNDFLFGMWPIKGKLNGNGNSRTYTVDPLSFPPMGSDFIFVIHPTNEKIMPGVCSAMIN